jgi:hypothetical protein
VRISEVRDILTGRICKRNYPKVKRQKDARTSKYYVKCITAIESDLETRYTDSSINTTVRPKVNDAVTGAEAPTSVIMDA